jgi:glutathione S-transferase
VDITAIVASWSDCRARFGAGVPFLFGAFSAADAYYAPVVRRFLGFAVQLPEVAAAYVATMDALPAMRAWVTAGLAEHDFVEVGRALSRAAGPQVTFTPNEERAWAWVKVPPEHHPLFQAALPKDDRVET